MHRDCQKKGRQQSVQLPRPVVQIESLAASEQNRKTARSDRETGSRDDAVSDDISAENDVSKLQSGTEAQMTSERQQQVQQLAQKLGHGTKSDLQVTIAT